jgi:hypothetical protein
MDPNGGVRWNRVQDTTDKQGASVSDGNKVGLNDAGETATGSVSDTHTFGVCVHIVDATLGCGWAFLHGGASNSGQSIKPLT